MKRLSPSVLEARIAEGRALTVWREWCAAPDGEATHFIDSPYIGMGGHYVHGSGGIDYSALAVWCRRRRGQPIVCEAPTAKWLPFRAIGSIKSGPASRSSVEAMWP